MMTKTIPLILLLTAPIAGVSHAGADTFQNLFTVQHSRTRNYVRYDARVDDDGELNPKSPVAAYWVLPDSGRVRALSALDRKALGFSIERDPSGEFYRMAVAAQPEREIKVYVSKHRPRAETLIGGRRCYLRRVYADIGGTLIPHVNYVDLIGWDVHTGKLRRERITSD